MGFVRRLKESFKSAKRDLTGLCSNVIFFDHLFRITHSCWGSLQDKTKVELLEHILRELDASGDTDSDRLSRIASILSSADGGEAFSGLILKTERNYKNRKNSNIKYFPKYFFQSSDIRYLKETFQRNLRGMPGLCRDDVLITVGSCQISNFAITLKRGGMDCVHVRYQDEMESLVRLLDFPSHPALLELAATRRLSFLINVGVSEKFLVGEFGDVNDKPSPSMLDSGRIKKILRELLSRLRLLYEEPQVIFSLSVVPVKYSRLPTDSFSADFLNKSLLRLVLHELTAEEVGVFYFPANEICNYGGRFIGVDSIPADGQLSHLNDSQQLLIADIFYDMFLGEKFEVKNVGRCAVEIIDILKDK